MPFGPNDLDELRERIRKACKNITPDMLEEVVEDYETRLRRVLQTEGELVGANAKKEKDFGDMYLWDIDNQLL